MTRKHSGPLPGGRSSTVTITCKRCQQVQTLDKLSTWPVPCRTCTAPIAPGWYWKERGSSAAK